MHRRLQRTRVLVMLMVMACVSVLLTGNARAQGPGGFGGFNGFDEITRPEFSNRDVPTVVQTFALDENQRQLVQLFVDEYVDTFTEFRDEVRAEMAMFRERFVNDRDGDRPNWREMIEQLSDRVTPYRQRRSQLRNDLMANIKSILTDDQLNQWDRFERTMRRQQLLPQGLLSGESVDLFKVTEEAGLSQSDMIAIEPILEQYSVQLDQALQKRQSDMPNAERAMREAVQSFDPEELLDVAERQRVLRMRIRDINLSFAQQIETRVSEPEVFREVFNMRAFPEIYEETDTDKIFTAAQNLDSLSESQRVSVTALAQNYASRLQQVRKQLRTTVISEQPKQAERMLERMTARMRGGRGDFNDEDPIRQAFEKRRELESQMVSQLHNILSEDQIKQLPTRETRPDWRDRRGGGGRGGGGGFRRGGGDGFGGRGG